MSSRSYASHCNAFVAKLIRLQQDGKEAISGPGNWREAPLLEVPTEPEEFLDKLLDNLCPGGGDDSIGCWHWMIGSPGNGKSAKLGFLARRLLARGYEIVSEDGVALVDADPEWLPYVLEVREPGKRFRFAYLVQDASVVRNPFSAVCDPAHDLAEVLREAATRGVSLLLCTNWGVLQRLFDSGHTNPEIRNEPWFRSVAKAVGNDHEAVVVYPPEDGKPVFRELHITYEVLDNRSLLVNSDVFERLLAKATSPAKWSECDGCPSLSVCPMRANREDLLDETSQRNVLQVLRRAETLDGQVIVFREAVALVSLFLAGCPNDHGSLSPCEWVHHQIEQGASFNLLARRLPALLFGSSKTYGLEGSSRGVPGAGTARRLQLEALDAVGQLLGRSSPAQRAVEAVVAGRGLSVDVGIERLLGDEGTLQRLDPSLDPRHAAALDDFAAVVTALEPGEVTREIGAVERLCMQHWESMFESIEAEGDPVSGLGLYFWVRRWQSTVLGWIAAVARGITAQQEELDQYLSFLSEAGERSERLATMRRLENVLEELLAPRSGIGGGVQLELSPSMRLTGPWAERELRPRLQHDDERSNNAVYVKMSRHHPYVISAESFSWLSLQQKFGLSDLSFNPEILESLRRAQAQAAAASGYSVQDDDVEVIIVEEDGKQHRLERTRGFLLEPEEL